MKISLNWLADYVELPATPEETAAKLTLAGLEIEGVERLGEGLDGVVVAHILESVPHPNAEKLSVTQVDAGPKHGKLQIVCGAKNYKVGDKVPLATVGTKLPGGIEIKQAKLRGVDSAGMLCSAKELAIAEDASGLLILDPSAQVGMPIAEALGLRDVVFEVNVTPNRPDALSHIGIAREVATITGTPLKVPSVELTEDGSPVESLVKVEVRDYERCPRYTARALEGAAIGPSPMWMQNRLRAVGVRAISNAVDVTNYVLLECGQPLHAFDLDLVPNGHVIVRRAGEGEKMTTLDGKERTLTADDLVICDEKSPSALAGVMGGATSEVSDKTRRILLESAYFLPSGVRRSSARHGLHTESSHRFERGVDYEAVTWAQDRAAQLLAQLCGAKIARGRIDARKAPLARRQFKLRFARIGDLLGMPVPAETTERILTGLGFKLTERTAESAMVEVPSWRVDVDGEADCVEEIARLQGYGTIPARLPRGVSDLAPEPVGQAVERRLRLALSAAGFDEVVNYSFVSPKDLEVLKPGAKPILVKNPLAPEQEAMCTTRLAGLLVNVRHNLNRQVEDVRFYELGRTYLPSQDKGSTQPADEPRMLAGVLVGHRDPHQWGERREAVDFFDLKGAIEQLVESIGARDVRYVSVTDRPHLHPRSACELRIAGKPVGSFGELHPKAAQALSLPRGVFVFELAVEALEQGAHLVPRSKSLPRFPAVLRDLAVVLDDTVAAADVEAEIRAAGGQLVEEVTLFDLYRGQGVPQGKKSLAFAVRLRAAERTLTDEEAVKAHAAIVSRLGEKFGATLRG